MFLLILEDGYVYKKPTITEEEKEESEAGILTIINIENPEEPLILSENYAWKRVESYPYET